VRVRWLAENRVTGQVGGRVSDANVKRRRAILRKARKAYVLLRELLVDLMWSGDGGGGTRDPVLLQGIVGHLFEPAMALVNVWMGVPRPLRVRSQRAQ
jgi:hypothetical protein